MLKSNLLYHLRTSGIMRTMGFVSFLYFLIFLLSRFVSVGYASTEYESSSLFIQNPLLSIINSQNQEYMKYSRPPAPMVTGYFYKPIPYITYYPKAYPVVHVYQKQIQKLSMVIGQLNPNVPSYDREKIAKYIIHYTKHLSWPTPTAVASIIYIESTFDKNAVSYAGARGLMQLSSCWRGKWPNSAFRTIHYNIKYGVKLLRENYIEYHRSARAAVLVYNCGSVAYNNGYATNYYYQHYAQTQNQIKHLWIST